jgi:hypothetical protein
MEYINKPAMRRDCCYANCDRPGTIRIVKNGNPDTQWICRFHRDLWNADRDCFIAAGLGCAMEEL